MKITISNFVRLFAILLWINTYNPALTAQRLVTPRVSPPTELKQTIGLTDITINYSRPKAKRDGQDRQARAGGALRLAACPENRVRAARRAAACMAAQHGATSRGSSISLAP